MRATLRWTGPSAVDSGPAVQAAGWPELSTFLAHISYQSAPPAGFEPATPGLGNRLEGLSLSVVSCRCLWNRQCSQGFRVVSALVPFSSLSVISQPVTDTSRTLQRGRLSRGSAFLHHPWVWAPLVEQVPDCVDHELTDFESFVTEFDGCWHPSSPARPIALLLWSLKVQFM